MAPIRRKFTLARYVDGDRVRDATDRDDLASLLAVYDAVVPAGESTKTGSGVAHFERRPDRDHPGNTSCFFVVRTDGSSIDFSTRRALDVAGAQGR
jgi:hypothetical protein